MSWALLNLTLRIGEGISWKSLGASKSFLANSHVYPQFRRFSWKILFISSWQQQYNQRQMCLSHFGSHRINLIPDEGLDHCTPFTHHYLVDTLKSVNNYLFIQPLYQPTMHKHIATTARAKWKWKSEKKENNLHEFIPLSCLFTCLRYHMKERRRVERARVLYEEIALELVIIFRMIKFMCVELHSSFTRECTGNFVILVNFPMLWSTSTAQSIMTV